ncbi:hypothetical protein AUJ77_01015 [Candidatus Nomurabacteria bacterium CG1_02_43_90]|uniref:Uncharacterized protein n=1 Tax=Candidatus Nomurabacteria bacterium CG1_02_43_90 TaxID=1805281 RepID=A0A1J4V4J3_9BACT|nr:MAG: hypothetical protein AUJ77_01015 [Candidatus Nomurabacteria bacterium CG1_02_43_90]
MKFLNFIKKHAIITSSLFVLLFIITSFGLKIKSTNAIMPFGGKIQKVTYCTCSLNLAILVGPPGPGVFTYEPGASSIKAFYQIFRPGPWVLGSYTPGGVCTSWYICGTSPCCLPDMTTPPPIGTISDAGTSM